MFIISKYFKNFKNKKKKTSKNALNGEICDSNCKISTKNIKKMGK